MTFLRCLYKDKLHLCECKGKGVSIYRYIYIYKYILSVRKVATGVKG